MVRGRWVQVATGWVVGAQAEACSLVADEVGDGFGYAGELGGAELWVHREAQDFLCGVFGVREIAGLVTQRGIKRLKV